MVPTDNPLDLTLRAAAVVNQHDLAFFHRAHRRLTRDLCDSGSCKGNHDRRPGETGQ
jgi:hypothetical protein